MLYLALPHIHSESLTGCSVYRGTGAAAGETEHGVEQGEARRHGTGLVQCQTACVKFSFRLRVEFVERNTTRDKYTL